MHLERNILPKYISTKINIKVIAIFVGLCVIHAEQQSIIGRVKLVDKPLQYLTFLALVEIDLMDFRNCQCNCSRQRKWAMNITDHHTKYVYTAPLKDKTADETLQLFQRYCFTYGFPKKILTDNGREFVNKKMEAFCKENEIKMAHGSPRTPTTQGLVERSNRSWKKDMRALILSTSFQNLKKWRQKAKKQLILVISATIEQ